METIYLLKNNANGKIYVGRTGRLSNRKKLHINSLRANRHPNKILQEDFNKYGESEFEFEIAEESEKGFGRTYIERQWMIKLKTYDVNYGYNYNDPCFMHRGCKPTKILLGLKE